METTAPVAPMIMGHEVLQLLAEREGPCTLEELRALAAARFGPRAVYGNCHGDRFGFDGLVEFLGLAGKLSVRGDRVALGHVPGCSGH